jgi:hypothetical protein
MATEPHTPVEVYQFRVYLREISPMIWRRLLLRSDHTSADLHYSIQIAMDWDDFHLHQFLIRGKHYGVSRLYGPYFLENGHDVPLHLFQFRPHERFLYEYDFGDRWEHEIRLEKRIPLDPKKTYPLCIGGARNAPEEDCGGPWAFQELASHYSLPYMADVLWQVIEGELSRDDCWEELHAFQYWLNVNRFDRRAVNRRLRWYAAGDERWRERIV